MPKRISVEVSDRTYEELSSLSALFKQSVSQTVEDALEAIEWKFGFLERWHKEYKVPISPKAVFFHTFDAGGRSMELFNEILEKLDAKGHFCLQDFEFDLDRFSFTFTYAILEGSKLNVDSFGLTLEPGIKVLRVDSIVEAAKVSKVALEKLGSAVEDFSEQESDGFMETESFNVEFEDDEDYPRLVITCEAESLEYFPTITKLSKVIGRLFKQSGIAKRT